MRTMDERNAMDVSAVRALEEADRTRTLWTDDDRAWASRAAAQVVGQDAPPEEFIARRAALALERLSTRGSAFPAAIRAWRWRPWVGVTIVVAAFGLGVAVDRIDSSQRFNVLAPPVLLLVLWNLAVYAAMAGGYVLHYGDARPLGFIRRTVVRLAADRAPARPQREGNADPVPLAMLAWGRNWLGVAGPLYATRAAYVMHLAGAALALGVFIGLIWRGITIEYRATWESTFLDAPFVHRLVSIFYAPGVWMTGSAIPGVDAIAAMRAPGSENAAPWLRWMGATLGLVVILPRLLLALIARLVGRHRASRLPIALDEPYYKRLLRGLHDGPVPVRVVPYSFTPDPAAASTLAAILGRAVGGNAQVTMTPVVEYGAEAMSTPTSPAEWQVLLFSLAATPEPETHGAFLAAMVRNTSTGESPLAVVDEAGFRARLGDDAARLDARRKLWRRLGDEHRCPLLFVDLAAPDFAAAERALDATLASVQRPPP